MTKERLRSYRQLRMEIEQLRRQLDEIEASLYSPEASHITGMPRGGQKYSERIDRLITQHSELSERYRAKIAQQVTEMLEIEKSVEALEVPAMRLLLRYRYLEGLSWNEVCEKMGYSWRQTHRIHGRALETLKQKEEIPK